MSTHTTPGRRYVPGQTVANSARHLNETVDKLSRVERDQRTFSNAVKRTPRGPRSFPRPVVITNCTTGTPGVVKIKLSTGPGSTTAKAGAPEEYAWIGTDVLPTTGTALWADRISEEVDSIQVKWLIRELTGGGSIQRFIVTGVFDDYIEGKTYNGTTVGTETVKIAKPWCLRWMTGQRVASYTYTYVDAQTRTVYSSGLGITETQKITPPYLIGMQGANGPDQIWATKPIGGTGVSGADWIDMNICARAFAKVE